MHFFESVNFGNVPWQQLSLAAWVLILVALGFDFLNGFHDAANSVATVVSTRVLTPQVAILWASAFNIVAFAVFPLKVSRTIQETINNADMTVIAATLLAACLWNLLTWWLALPTSSSHALIGGLVGAALAKSGGSVDVLSGWELGKTVLFIVVSPVLGLLFGMAIALAVLWTFRKATPRGVDRVFRHGQLVSAAWFSLNHGGNDAQKTLGVIALLVQLSTGARYGRATPLPTEFVLACFMAIGLGTMFGGWRIVKTMGQRIIPLRPVDGFCAETGAGLAVGLATLLGGIPVSTTHTITGAITGVGALKRFSAVRWGVAGRVVWAWVLTIPAAATVAALCWWVIEAVT